MRQTFPLLTCVVILTVLLAGCGITTSRPRAGVEPAAQPPERQPATADVQTPPDSVAAGVRAVDRGQAGRQGQAARRVYTAGTDALGRNGQTRQRGRNRDQSGGHCPQHRAPGRTLGRQAITAWASYLAPLPPSPHCSC